MLADILIGVLMGSAFYFAYWCGRHDCDKTGCYRKSDKDG